jgi:two-component system chemotaxis response regulator CheB
VLVVSAACDEGAAATVQALALGAADTLVKPGAGTPHARFAELLGNKLDRLTRREAPTADAGLSAPAPPPSREIYDIVAIGASTGGIHALSLLLRELPASFTVPILITQHLPASFMPYFAAQVAVVANRPCEVAVDRLRLRPGRVVIAPGDAHIRCIALPDGTVALRLSTSPSSSGCLPSVDPMLESVAAAYGQRALAVILSGMGRDGAEGARRITEAGGAVVVQDEASSVIWGMPGAVAAAGNARAMLPPEQIGQLIASRRAPQ